MDKTSIPHTPLFTCQVELEKFNTVGWLCVHSIGKRGCCGGIRLYPDVTREEVESLAMAMTYKYSFLKYELGGAKAGLQIPFDTPIDQRNEMLREFGRKISIFVKKNIYTPWTDMNCTNDDLACIYEGVGKKLKAQRSQSSLHTARSLFYSIKAAADYLNMPLEKCRIAIEGLGSVGSHLAYYLHCSNATIVGVSTKEGAAISKDGLDITQLLEYREKLGDNFVNQSSSWNKTDTNKLFSLPCDIFIPCARPHSINERIASTINCKAIVSGANLAFTQEAHKVLCKRNILAMPGFLVNSGGILGSGLENAGIEESQIEHLYANSYHPMVIRCIEIAKAQNTSIQDIAMQEILPDYRKIVESYNLKLKRFSKIGKYFKSILPNKSPEALAEKRLELAKNVFDSRFK